MKLRRVQIQNFRSVVDSGVVEIGDRVTVLIGKNEQGKTNFLKALASFNPKKNYSPNDLPTHLRPALEEKNPSEIGIVTLWLSVEPSDKEKLRGVISGIGNIEEFKATRYYDGHYTYLAVRQGDVESQIEFAPPNISTSVDEIRREAETLKEKLNTHAGRVPAFAPSLVSAQAHIDQFTGAKFDELTQIDNLIKTFAAGLKALPAQDPAIQEDIAVTIKHIEAKYSEVQQTLQKDPRRMFEQNIPRFIFHSTVLDRIPNEVNISDFIRDPEGTSKGMANLCAVAGLSTQKIQELAIATDRSQREAYEDHYRGQISGGLNEYWRQETYTVHFHIDKEKLSVSISDNTYSQRIIPSERSDGFQWYLSFYSALLSEVSAVDPTIVLLDNPALELHADGQRDIKRFLEEKLPTQTQVVYVTHSPAMIDTYNLEQVCQVDLLGDKQGTKVGKLKIREGDDFDLLEPVRSAIGASLISSLIFNEFNVLVEGAADKPILEGAFMVFRGDESKKILVNGSISETKGGFLPRFYQRAGLPFVVYLDGDSRGRELAGSLGKWGILENKIVKAGDLFREEMREDFELEDLISENFYQEAVEEAYPERSVEPPKDWSGKRTKYYESKFKEQHAIGFNKRRVGEVIKKLLLQGKRDDKTVERLKKLTEQIWNTLQSQIRVQGTK